MYSSQLTRRAKNCETVDITAIFKPITLMYSLMVMATATKNNQQLPINKTQTRTTQFLLTESLQIG